MVQLNLVTMMWSMRQMTKVFENAPDIAHYNNYNTGKGAAAIKPYFTETKWGGPSFTTWVENNIEMPTAKWIESQTNTGYYHITNMYYGRDGDSKRVDVDLLTKNLDER